MPKHRSTVYTVVRFTSNGGDIQDSHVVGTYLSHQRADEVAAAYDQEMKDKGVRNVWFEAQAGTWYEE